MVKKAQKRAVTTSMKKALKTKDAPSGLPPKGKSGAGAPRTAAFAKQWDAGLKRDPLRPDGKPWKLARITNEPMRNPVAELLADQAAPGPFVDNQGRMVVQVNRELKAPEPDPLVKHSRPPVLTVTIIDRGSWGFRLQELSAVDFDKKYKPVTDYPEAVDNFLKPIKELGAPAGVLMYIPKVSRLTAVELEQAAEVQTSKQIAFKERIMEAKKRKAGVKKATAGKKAEAKAKATKSPGEKRVTAASMFKELIMAGNFSDDVIFKKVQDKFGLDDKKRGYVAWYRNNLKKGGAKPPEPKGA